MANELHTPHDIFFKNSLENPIIARDFFNAHLPEFIKKHIDLATLQVERGSFIDSEYSQYHADMLFSATIDENKGYVYLLVEHQSSLTNAQLMPLRMLEYLLRILVQYQDQKTAQLPLVIPLVYYHGTISPYPYSTNIFDYFSNKELAKAVMFQPFQLIDLTVTPDEEIKQHQHAAVMKMLHKHVFARDIVPTIRFLYQQGLWTIWQQIADSEHKEIVLKYVYYQSDSEQALEVTNILRQALPNAEEQIMTIAQRLEKYFREEGHAQGHAQGHVQGSREALYKVAKNLLVAQIDKEIILKTTNLSLEQLQQLEQELSH